VATAETARLLASLELEDKFSPGVNKVTASLGRLDKATTGSTSSIARIARGLQGLDRNTSNTQRSLGRFSQNIQRGLVVGATAVAGSIFAVVHAASDYESAFAGVRKTVTATEPELKALSEGFREMSKTIPVSASELARLGEAGGALGVPTKQLKEFVRVTALLGVTTNLTADEAATSLGVLGNVLHLTGAEYSKFASSLVALGNAGASTESDIIAIAQRAGAAAHLVGLSTQSVLGFSSAVASLGIEAEAGGTALQKFFIDSAKSILGGGADLKEFAKIAGTSAKAFQRAFKEDAAGALQDFLAGLGKLSQQRQLEVLKDLGFTDARITRTLLGLANNTKLVSDQMGVANTAFAQNTALTKEAEQRFNTFDSQVQITKNTLTDMAITIGSKLLPKITPLLKQLNEFIGANQDKIGQFGDKLASGFESFANELKKVDFGPIIDGLKLSGSIAKQVIDIFRSLPGPLQAALVGGFALNKITGGLPTAIVKDIGGAVIGQLAQRGNTPARPLFVSDVTGGLGKGIAGAAEGAAAKSLGSRLLLGLGTIVTKLAGLALVFGGLQGITAGVNIGGPAGAGAAALGGAGVIAGGALLAGPLGAIAGSLVAVGKTLLDIRDRSAAQGQDIATSIASEISGGATTADLRKSLDAVNQGINDIQANPLNVLLAGDALDQLRAQRDVLERAIAPTMTGMEQHTGKMADDLGVVALAQKATLAEFGKMLTALKAARKPEDIRKAVAEAVAQVIGKARGNVENTRATLAGLKAALARTHDPKLEASIRSAIAKVEKKIVGREFAQRQIAALDKILRSDATGNRKIDALNATQKALLTRGLPKAARDIGTRTDRAKEAISRSMMQSARGIESSVNRKKLSVTVNNTTSTNVSVSGRAVFAQQRTFSRYYSTSSAGPGK
jgi:TP901 family phage tail tape measure protein